jgi:predicted nucleic acid-binding protein
LGLVTNPKRSPQNLQCAQWLQRLIAAGDRIILPEIADYEVRRELLRGNKSRGLAQLDKLAQLLEYLPLNTVAMRQAAAFWASARQQGRPTASDHSIDADAILAAQAVTLGVANAVIATTNVSHLARFAPAQLWNQLKAASP